MVLLPTWVCSKSGLTLLASTFNRYHHQFQRTENLMAFCPYLQLLNINQTFVRSDVPCIQPCGKPLNVVRHPIEHPTHTQAPMTLPTRPYAIFSTLQGTQALTQSQPCKELKMPTPHAHPPPSGRNSYQLHFYHEQYKYHQQPTRCW